MSGWRFVGWATVLLGGMVAGLVAAFGTGEEGLALLLRWTARTTGLLFFAAFGASSLRMLWRSPASRWLLANRRYVGFSAGVSHTYHLGAVFALFRLPGMGPEFPIVIATGLAYAILFAMMATSFDRSAAWLGRRRWVLLHKTGSYYLWFVLVQTFAGAPHPLSIAMAVLGVAVLGLRIAAWRRSARRAPAAA